MKITAETGIISLLLLILVIAVSSASALTVPVNSTNVNHTILVSGLPQGANVQFVMNGGIPVPTRADNAGTAKYLPLIEGTLEIIAMSNGNVLSGYTAAVVPTATPTPTPTATTPAGGGGPVSGGGSSSGTGGKGVSTSEPIDNIVKFQRIDLNLIAGTPVTFSFTEPEFAIYEVVVTGKETETAVAIRVESLKGTSKLVTAPAPGTAYANENVWSGTKNIGDVLVRFRVKNSWIDSNSVAGTDIQLLKWSDSDWRPLETKQINKDGTYTYFESKTAGLSLFAISGMKAGAAQTPKQQVTAPPTAGTPSETGKPETPVATTTKAPGFESLGAFAAVVIVSAVYLFRRKGG